MFDIIFTCVYVLVSNYYSYIVLFYFCYLKKLSKNILGINISFSELILKLNSIISIEQNSFNIFSVDGIIQSFISIGLFNLIFSYALRYILIKVFILIAPFAFLSLINHSTSWFFKMYFRTLFSLLLLQSFVSIILIVIFSLKFNNTDLFSKFLYIGGIYALSRANSYIRDLIGGISTDISTNISRLKNTTNL